MLVEVNPAADGLTIKAVDRQQIRPLTEDGQ